MPCPCCQKCCTCANDWWQLRVNDVPVPLASFDGNTFGQSIPQDELCLMNYWPASYSVVPFGSVEAGVPTNFNGYWNTDPSQAFVFLGGANGCLNCLQGELVIALYVQILGSGQVTGTPTDDRYTAYYEVDASGGCEGVLSTAVIDPPEGAVRNDLIGGGGTIINKAVIRHCQGFAGGGFYDPGTDCADWDPESLTVTLTCFCEDSIVPLEFSSCIGSKAAGTATIEGGSVTGVTLTDGGSGFARLGRVEPTVTASVSGGSGATLSVTLAEQSENLGDGCMPAPYWEVDSVSVTAGGTGYSDGISVTFSVASGDTQITAAKAYAYVGFDEPANATVTVTSSGSGASLTPTWSTTTQPAPPIDRGGATSPPDCEKPPRDAYTVTGFTIGSAGSGYAVDDAVDISFALASDGVIYPGEPGAFAVDTVDGNGAITAVRVDYGGVYGGAFTDALAEVVVESCTANAGHYYREDASEAPYVATVTVHPENASPSAGTGDSITAVVDDDTSSGTFGHILSLSLSAGGSGFLGPCIYNPLP